MRPDSCTSDLDIVDDLSGCLATATNCVQEELDEYNQQQQLQSQEQQQQQEEPTKQSQSEPQSRSIMGLFTRNSAPAAHPDANNTALSDDDSFGPAPPPPEDPHPDDYGVNTFPGNNGNNSKNSVQIQGIDDVLSDKDDPPDHHTDEDDEDLSVEIPPTKVVQRMQAKQARDPENKADKKKWTTIAIMVGSLLLIVIIVLAAGFGTGAFKNDESASTDGNATHSSSGNGTYHQDDPLRPAALSSYLSLANNGGSAAFENATSPESLALNWLINEDPLQLGVETATDQFRLEQRYALLCLWFSSPSAWVDETGWLQVEDECEWYGVTCEATPIVDDSDGAITATSENAVVALDITANNVQGLPADISMLSELKSLDLADNVIAGPLPSTIVDMEKLELINLENNNMTQDLSSLDLSKLASTLTVLNLGGNSFSGTLPESLWSLSALTELIVRNNALEGTIPDEVANLQSLVVFDVSDNGGFTGDLPLVFLELPNLQVLGLGGNGFGGEIPTEYGSFPALTSLDLGENDLEGDIPEELSALSSLVVLRLGGNSFAEGNIPDFVFGMTSLELLDLSNMQLQGPIPSELGNLVALKELSLGGNFLTGNGPGEMSQLVALESLELQDNFLDGGLDFVSGMTGLVILNVSNNQFSEDFPDMSGMVNLQQFLAPENNFGSNFPESLTQIQTLEILDLSAAGLTGPLPDSLGGMQGLTQLRLNGNGLTGAIPDSISGLANLVILKLDNNDLNGPVPDTISDLVALEVLELHENQLTGAIPIQIGALFNLRTFRINDNASQGQGPGATATGGISGELPTSLGNLIFLENLEVHNNQMGGPLPTEMGNMHRLAYLDVEFNDFTGTVPAEFANMVGLQEFYLSNNGLTGAMPSGICEIETLRFLVPDCDITDCSCCTTCI